MLESGIRSWARAELWQRGWTVVDDVVAETAAEVVLAMRKARGADTFGGFVRGHYLNVRRRALGRALVSAQRRRRRTISTRRRPQA